MRLKKFLILLISVSLVFSVFNCALADKGSISPWPVSLPQSSQRAIIMHNLEEEDLKMVKDPVCGMEIDEKSTKFSIEYSGKTYFFCSENCKLKFEANPEHYIEKSPQTIHHHHEHKK